MATRIGTETQLNRMLEHLVELDFDAIEAYDAAIARIDDGESRERLEEFRNDHHRHTQELGRFLVDAGKKAPTKGNLKRVLTKGKVVIANMRGDKAILQAMRSNENDTNQAYERAVNHPDAPPMVRDTLHNALSDERRHRAWIEHRLTQLK